MRRVIVCSIAVITVALAAQVAVADTDHPPTDPRLRTLPAPTGERSQPLPAAGGDHGVRRARASGIAITTAAAAIMTRMPAVGCLNDPLKEGCPPVRRIQLISESSEAVLTGARAAAYGRAARSGVRAKASQTPQCAVNGDPPSIWYYGGTHWVHGPAQNTCTIYASSQELYATVQRFQKNSSTGVYFWASLAQAHAGPSPGGRTISAKAIYDCRHQSEYSYRTEGLGYAVVAGVGYIETDYGYSNHTCPT
jgi:hypothetical protein